MSRPPITHTLARYEARRNMTAHLAAETAERNALLTAFRGVGAGTRTRFYTARRARKLDADRYLTRLLNLAQKYGDL